MTESVWAHAIGASAKQGLELLLAAFSAVDITLNEDADGTRTDIAIVIFDPARPDLLARVRDLHQGQNRRIIGVMMDTRAHDQQMTWDCLSAGMSDVLRWTEPVQTLCEDICLKLKRWLKLQDVLSSPLVRDNLVGQSAAWTTALRRIAEAALFGTQPILITGESGTGKELCARLVHSLSPRPDKKELIILDCTTVSPELSGSEFFGHERGAYTGAASAREGAFALANKGTLFLDELGELDGPLQAKLLRVIQERRYKRVGGNDWKRSDFRLVSATNRDLAKEVKKGRFRADLLHRLSGYTIRLPKLDDRREDIPALAQHFLQSCLAQDDTAGFDPLVMSVLCANSYAGNVRELQQIVSRMVLRHPGSGPITPGMVPVDLRPQTAAPTSQDPSLFERAAAEALHARLSLKDIAREATEAAVRQALNASDGKVAQAAKLLSVTPRALQLREAGRKSH